ncbi:MAG: hypothetical protein Kow00122_03540 [Thermoleophilia bacterium]
MRAKEQANTCEGRPEGMNPEQFDRLRRARLESGLSVSAIAEAMDVRPAYLEALERGELGRLLGPAYVRSIAVRYAVCLGLDPESVADDGPDSAVPAAQGRPPETGAGCGERASASASRPAGNGRRRAVPPRRDGSRVRRAVIVGLLVVGLLILAVAAGLQLGVVDIGGARFFGGGVETTASATPIPSGPTAPAAAGAAVGAPASEAEVAAAPATAASATTLPVLEETGERQAAGGVASPTTTVPRSPSPGAFTLVLTPTAEVWLEIRDETTGRALFVGNRPKGEVLRLQAEGPVTAVVGRPEVLEVSLDGRPVAVPNVQRWRVTGEGVEAR